MKAEEGSSKFLEGRSGKVPDKPIKGGGKPLGLHSNLYWAE